MQETKKINFEYLIIEQKQVAKNILTTLDVVCGTALCCDSTYKIRGAHFSSINHQ